MKQTPKKKIQKIEKIQFTEQTKIHQSEESIFLSLESLSEAYLDISIQRENDLVFFKETQIPSKISDNYPTLLEFIEKYEVQSLENFTCKFCKKTFKTGCALGGHISKKHEGILSQIRKKVKSEISHPTEQQRNKFLRSIRKKIN